MLTYSHMTNKSLKPLVIHRNDSYQWVKMIVKLLVKVRSLIELVKEPSVLVRGGRCEKVRLNSQNIRVKERLIPSLQELFR